MPAGHVAVSAGTVVERVGVGHVSASSAALSSASPVSSELPHSTTCAMLSITGLTSISVPLVYSVFSVYSFRSRLHATPLCSLRLPTLVIYSLLRPHQPAADIRFLCPTHSRVAFAQARLPSNGKNTTSVKRVALHAMCSFLSACHVYSHFCP